MGRAFNDSQRAALYLAADGRCAHCGTTLEPGWHADHQTPWVAGGDTDVINGQALCPRCNLIKGARVLRAWQETALEKFFSNTPDDFTVCATPGAGKTTFALTLAQRLKEQGLIERIVVVVPTDALRQQWADQAAQFNLHLMPVKDSEDYDKRGYDGCVLTYQQVAMGAGRDLVRRSTRRPTVAILDEIHHAGEHRSWGDGLRHALENAKHRIALTGTPWRQDKTSPIPFVRYDSNDRVHVDCGYEYGEAVAEGVCRQIEFHAYDGTAKWMDCGKVSEAELGADLAEESVAAALDAALRPDHAWMPALLNKAIDALNELREEIPDAGGLVVAQTQGYAREYAKLIQERTGEKPTLAVSDDPEAKAEIDRFRKATSPWLVAVKMVSEGVDIPRLALGVYASKARTPLFFRQVVGRFVRTRPDEELNALLYIPAVPALMRHAKEIEGELRHQLEMETEQAQRSQPDLDDPGGQGSFDLREPLSASQAEFSSVIYRGEEDEAQRYEKAKALANELGIPVRYAANMLPLVAEREAKATAPAPPVQPAVPQPRHRQEKLLRGEITKLVGKIGHRVEGGQKWVNAELLRAGFAPRNKQDVTELERCRDYCARWLRNVS